VKKPIHLLMQGGGDARIALADVEAPNATGHIEKHVAIDILKASAFRALYENGSQLRNTARDSGRFALG
jgi:hypothetical protein